MIPIYPLSGALPQSAAARRHRLLDKKRQIRRSQPLDINSAIADVHFDQAVEKTEVLRPAIEQGQSRQERKRRFLKKTMNHSLAEVDSDSHLDVTA